MPVAGEALPPHREPVASPRHGRLTVRRHPPVAAATCTGLIPATDLDGKLLALSYVPEPVDGRPYRLALLLHGAGGTPQQGLDLLWPLADEQRLLLVAPQSTTTSWDLIGAEFGPDIQRINQLLGEIFAGYPVAGMLIGGFSDGASYALSVGLINGDLFEAVLAFSPGFFAPLVTHGMPRIFISHGDADPVLPAHLCSRRLVPRLRALDYEVTYEEFAGGHEVPEEVARHAVDWWLRSD